MRHIESKTISFYQTDRTYPTRDTIREGIYALNRVTGHWQKIHPGVDRIDHNVYSFYALASSFPATSKYDEKYADLVEAKEILKRDRYAYDYDSIGKAIGLIKRFLDKNAKV